MIWERERGRAGNVGHRAPSHKSANYSDSNIHWKDQDQYYSDSTFDSKDSLDCIFIAFIFYFQTEKAIRCKVLDISSNSISMDSNAID